MKKWAQKCFAALATFTLGAQLAAPAVHAEVDKSQELVIYSNSASNGRGEWITEKAAEAGYKIRVVDIAGAELTDRLIGEKNNAVADMFFGLNTIEYEKLKKENLLAKYEPTWKADVDMSLGDAEGYYYPIAVQPLVLIGTDKTTMPSDWTDLIKDEYKGKYGIAGLNGGTSKTILASILARYKDDAGELNVSQEGWDLVKAYVQNAIVYAKGQDYITELLDEKNPLTYSMMWGSGVLQNEKERSVKFNVMTPEIGEPFVTEQAAVISTSKKAELAQDFINWLGSDKIQAEWSKKFGTIPANKKALEAATPEVKEFAAKTKPQQLDWKFIGEHIDSWVEKVELEFMH